MLPAVGRCRLSRSRAHCIQSFIHSLMHSVTYKRILYRLTHLCERSEAMCQYWTQESFFFVVPIPWPLSFRLSAPSTLLFLLSTSRLLYIFIVGSSRAFSCRGTSHEQSPSPIYAAHILRIRCLQLTHGLPYDFRLPLPPINIFHT